MTEDTQTNQEPMYEVNTLWREVDSDNIYVIDRITKTLGEGYVYTLNDGVDAISVRSGTIESFYTNISAELKPVAQETMVPFSYGKSITPAELFKIYQQAEINGLMMSRRRVNPFSLVKGQGNMRQEPVRLKDAIGYWMSDTVMMTTEASDTDSEDVEYIVEHTLVGFLFTSKLGDDRDDVLEAEDMSARFALVPTYLDPTYARGTNETTIFPPIDFDYTPIQVEVEESEGAFSGDESVVS